jgi:tetratricopeptide (TPR) repeat protein
MAIYLFTGQPGSGKTTLGKKLQIWLQTDKKNWRKSVFHIDGDQLIELFPNQNFVFYLNAAAKYQAKDFAAAAIAYHQALAITFDNKEMQAQIYSGLGDVYNELKQYAKSDSFYNASLDLKPDEVFVLNNYAYYLALRKEQLPKAAQMAKHANELQPNNASFEDTYAWVLFKMANYEQALIWIDLDLSHSETQTATLMEHYGDILYFLTKGNHKYFIFEGN